MENIVISKLGRAKIGQFNIGSKVDIGFLTNFFYNNIKEIKSILASKPDIFGQEIYDNLLKKKELPYTLNKQEELFILKNKNNFQITFDYLTFRYKFLRCGRDKVNIGYPPYLLIEPVSTCNLRCPFCFQTDKSFTKKPYMGIIDYALFTKIVDEASDLGVGAVTLASRGEPTLHKQLTEMMKYLGSKKNIYEKKLNTNATFLSDKIAHSIFTNEFTQIIISADHYEKGEYERLRKNSNFEKILKNVDNLYNVREKYYPKSITEIRISGVDHDKNLDRIKFRDFWMKRADQVTAGYPLERWDTYFNIPHEEINDPCEYLWDRMYVWWDGKVNPCDADYKSYLSYGNFNDNSIKEIWNGKKINEHRNHHINNLRNKVNPCDRCGVCFK